MKRIIFFVFVIFHSVNIKATNLPLDSIKQSIISFLVEEERYPQPSKIDDFCNCLILNSKSKVEIRQGSEGVFLFFSLSEHGNLHFILIEKDKCRIINMIDPFEKNLMILMAFMKKHHYSKGDIYLYLSEFVRVIEHNKNN